MSIEQNLERIANALEVIAHATMRDVQILEGTPAETLEKIAELAAADAEKPKSYAEQRKAEVAAETKQTEPEKKPRGRPKKEVTAAPKEEPKPPVVEEDPFADPVEAAPEPEEVLTEELVRNTMVSLRKKLVAELGDVAGKEKAFSVLREYGNGATTLPGSTAARAAGDAGVLKPEYFKAVVTAARKLLG
jgi:hypothetical protein